MVPEQVELLKETPSLKGQLAEAWSDAHLSRIHGMLGEKQLRFGALIELRMFPTPSATRNL